MTKDKQYIIDYIIQNMSPTQNELLKKTDEIIRKIRCKTLRNLAHMWRFYHGFLTIWMFKTGFRKQEDMLKAEYIQNIYYCSRRTAYDYMNTLKVIELTEELANEDLKMLLKLSSNK